MAIEPHWPWRGDHAPSIALWRSPNQHRHTTKGKRQTKETGAGQKPTPVIIYSSHLLRIYYPSIAP
ncbi:MAG: hypothetical protein EA001_15545 [Oscillatoriales cyanobacterium]|nr:MAG: hypothetical protein EA001_15545 [Oscillatoriales cyanobacterium]